MSENGTLLMGAVVYDAKVVTIWEGFREYFVARGWTLTTSCTPTTSGRSSPTWLATCTWPGTRPSPGSRPRQGRRSWGAAPRRFACAIPTAT